MGALYNSFKCRRAVCCWQWLRSNCLPSKIPHDSKKLDNLLLPKYNFDNNWHLSDLHVDLCADNPVAGISYQSECSQEADKSLTEDECVRSWTRNIWCEHQTKWFHFQLKGHLIALILIPKSYFKPIFCNLGHDFCEGESIIRGRTCPWNTFALWTVDPLSLTGFPPVGDGHGPKREKGGVEVTSQPYVM